MKKDRPTNNSLYSLDINKKATEASFWKGWSILASIIAIISIGASIYFASYIPKKAYVVEVNTQTGVASYKENGITLLQDYKPSDASVMNDLQNFIKNFRGVSPDEAIMRERITKVYARVTSKARNTVEKFYEETKPMMRLRSERVEITVYNMHRVTENYYEFLFNERVFSREDNTLMSEDNKKMTIHITFYAPTTDRDRELNPLGIFIDDISLSSIKDLTTIN